MKHKRIGALLAAGAIVLAPLALAGCSSDPNRPYSFIYSCGKDAGKLPSSAELSLYQISCADAMRKAAATARQQSGNVKVHESSVGFIEGTAEQVASKLEEGARIITEHQGRLRTLEAQIPPEPSWEAGSNRDAWRATRDSLVSRAKADEESTETQLAKLGTAYAESSKPSPSASESAPSDSGIPMWAKIVGGVVGVIVLFFVWAFWSEKKDEERAVQREAQRKADLRRRLAEIDAAYDEKPVDYDAHVAKKAKKKQKKAKAQPAAPVSPAAELPPTVPDAQDVPAPDPQAAPAAEPPAPPPSGSILDQLRKSQ